MFLFFSLVSHWIWFFSTTLHIRLFFTSHAILLPYQFNLQGFFVWFQSDLYCGKNNIKSLSSYRMLNHSEILHFMTSKLSVSIGFSSMCNNYNSFPSNFVQSKVLSFSGRHLLSFYQIWNNNNSYSIELAPMDKYNQRKNQ